MNQGASKEQIPKNTEPYLETGDTLLLSQPEPATLNAKTTGTSKHEQPIMTLDRKQTDATSLSNEAKLGDGNRSNDDNDQGHTIDIDALDISVEDR